MYMLVFATMWFICGAIGVAVYALHEGELSKSEILGVCLGPIAVVGAVVIVFIGLCVEAGKEPAIVWKRKSSE